VGDAARASVEITEQIGAIQERVGAAVAAASGVRSTIERLAEMSNSVAASVEQQAGVTPTWRGTSTPSRRHRAQPQGGCGRFGQSRPGLGWRAVDRRPSQK
jgi:hypothetical protein